MEKKLFKTKKKLFIILYLLLISSSNAKDELKIGISTFLSGGAASSFGIPLKQGLEFMFNAINEGKVPAPYNTPGIGGKKASFFFIDNRLCSRPASHHCFVGRAKRAIR